MIDPLRGQADSALDSLLDRSQLRSILETEAPELLIEFYTLYLEQLCGMAEQIRSASFTNDFEAVARQAHKMT